MTIDVAGVSEIALWEYARIPIAFEVEAILDVAADHNGFRLSERPVERAYVKDYDAVADRPTEWTGRFDVSQWGLMIARIEGQCIGGAAVAYDTPELDMLEGRSDLAVLWDIRVLPENRRRGVGAALFGATEAWASARNCRQLKVETQNVNVAACRFYARRGCVLRAAHHGVYPGCPDEVQLLWYKDLDYRDWSAGNADRPSRTHHLRCSRHRRGRRRRAGASTRIERRWRGVGRDCVSQPAQWKY